MKNAEDEAFEDIERRQGGFQAKRKMAADKLQEPVANSFEEYCQTLHPLWNTHISRTYAEQFFMAGQAAQPAQEPVAYVTGMSFGRFIVEPLNPAMVLPIGMALYSAPQGKT
jgi:hypothetical protein